MTSDIQPHWYNVIRRLQSVAKRNNGAAVLSISVIVDENGVPISWTEPKICKIEPMSRIHDFLSLLTQFSS